MIGRLSSALESLECILKMKTNFSVGIIDIGSNSVRLMTVGKKKSKYLIITRLAEGKKGSELNEESMKRTAAAVKSLISLAREQGVQKIAVFATAAVRNSTNSFIMIEEIRRETGAPVEIVSGEVEAELAALGALDGDGGVIDIGGASTEICIKENKETVYKVSYDVGAVNLYGKFSRDRAEIEKYLSSLIKGIRRRFDLGFKVIGGSACTLAAIALNLKEYNPELVHGYFLTKEKLLAVANELYGLTVEEIKERYPFASQRADVIAGGASILLVVMTALSLSGVTVSENDNLEGYLKYKLGL